MPSRFVPHCAAAALLVSLSAGCGSVRPSTPDKAGGSQERSVLRLAAAYSDQQPDAQYPRYFATQVAKLSRGKLRVDVVFDAGGERVSDVEARVARLVRADRFDLGWIGARAWDELGVTSFQALQAPFLIDNYALLDKVVKSPLADEMLAGLKSQGVVGLALIPGLLRHPVGLWHPFVTVSDFAGARIRDFPSRATDALIEALGATPVHMSNASVSGAVAARRVDASEASFANAAVGGIVSANVTLYAKTLTLFAGARLFASLTEEQQRILRTAARRTLVQSATYPVNQALAFESVLARQYCRRNPGRAVVADKDQLTELERAARPVYRDLERDPKTERFITRIRQLKSSLPATPPIVVSARCQRPCQAATTGRAVSPSLLNGTYHWRLTKAAALAFGLPASTDADRTHFPIIQAVVLRDGKAKTLGGDQPMSGTYTVTGNRITFRWREFTYPTTFTFTRDPGGTLHLNAVQPMDRGDQFVWSGGPWQRVGPPVVTIP